MTVILGLAAATCWAIDNLISVRVTRTIAAVPALVWALGSGFLIGLPTWFAMNGLPAQLPPIDGLALASASAPAYVAGNAFFLLALRRGSLAIVAPLVGLDGGLAAVAGVILLGQVISPAMAVGLAVAVAGATLAASGRGERASGGVGWALASAGCFAVTFLCLGEAHGISPLAAVVLNRGLALVLLGAWIAHSHEPLDVAPAMRRATIVLGGIDVLAFTLFATAAAIGPLSVASVTAAQFATIAAVLGVIVLAERLRALQYVGIALTLAAVAVLSTS